jgi:hypothetical protein
VECCVRINKTSEFIGDFVDRKRIAAAVIVIVVIIGVSFVLINNNSNNPAGNIFNPPPPPPEPRIIKIDESSTSQPYDQLFTTYGTIDLIVSLNSETTSWSLSKLIVTDEQVASLLRLSSAADLYCKNGTSKIFYGECHFKGRTVSVGTDLLMQSQGFWCVLQKCPYTIYDSEFQVMLIDALYLNAPAPSLPDAPVILSITNPLPNSPAPYSIKITISYVAGNTGYNIYKSDISIPTTGAISSLIIARMPSQSAQFVYTDYISDLGTYYYAVTARNAAGESALSNQVSVTSTVPLQNDHLIHDQYRQVRIDEVVTPRFQPYDMILNDFNYEPGSFITLNFNSKSLKCVKLTLSDDSLCGYFKISKSLLYCTNGTARIIYGASIITLPEYSAMIFKRSGFWYEANPAWSLPLSGIAFSVTSVDMTSAISAALQYS